MKKILLLTLLITALGAKAQFDSTEAPFRRFPTLPPFQLLQLDSVSTLTKDDLRKNRPVLLMYFSPDCDHCQHQIEDILKDIKDFNDIQLVLATIQPYDQMKAFNEQYQLAKHPNIFLGRDTKFFLPPFFKMNTLPFMALYNRKGDLITTFEGNVKTGALLKAFRK